MSERPQAGERGAGFLSTLRTHTCTGASSAGDPHHAHVLPVGLFQSRPIC